VRQLNFLLRGERCSGRFSRHQRVRVRRGRRPRRRNSWLSSMRT
jgi:hypothetical protein